MDGSAKQQIIEKLKGANNVLVTVSSSPSIDQLSAAIGLTLMLNKLGKHATAVYSGKTPSTIEFLHPAQSIEKNTDSLQDFIISLDKSKADKLRYKEEDNVVKIFITPYKTSISEADLEFSQGDFNVDAVVALGVDERQHLDQAITSHGRILHDAVVMTVTVGEKASNIGSLNWQEANASSLCEMLVSISESFQNGLLDTQMSTAFLTGIVAETERFKNEKTTPKVMTMAAQLMAAGANQQLIADSLAPPASAKGGYRPELDTHEAPPKSEQTKPAGDNDKTSGPADDSQADSTPEGSVSDISQPQAKLAAPATPTPPKKASKAPGLSLNDLDGADVKYGNSTDEEGHPVADENQEAAKINIDEHGKLTQAEEMALEGSPDSSDINADVPPPAEVSADFQPPDAPTEEGSQPPSQSQDPASEPPAEPDDSSHKMLQPDSPTDGDNQEQPSLEDGERYVTSKPKKVIHPLGQQPNADEDDPETQNEGAEKTLTDLESAVGLDGQDEPSVSTELARHRDEVSQAFAADPNITPGPIRALNAQPMTQDTSLGAPPAMPPPIMPPPPSMQPGSGDNQSDPLPPPAP